MTLFKYNSYLSFIKAWLKDQPRGGRGIKGQIARELGISTTLVSFFFAGDKIPTLEQASDLADFIGLNEYEAQYFLTLIEMERAGHSRLKQRFAQRAKKEKEEGLRLKSKVKRDKRLNEEESSLYYSSWIYTGVRNLIAIPEINDPKVISERLNISIPMVNQALQVMLSMGLVVKTNDGYEIGPTYTYIDEDSPHTSQFRKNWRLRGFDSMDKKQKQNLFYSCPMSLSAEDAEEVRQSVMRLIVATVDRMRPSPSEVVRCLNIDWFEY